MVSRVRVRPSRHETRTRLFEAAAEVFGERGIGAASIDAIAEAAGFTRGAFYSNFENKDELIIAMLEDHVEQTTRRNLELLATHGHPADFLAALRVVDRSEQDPLGRSPLLHMELILYSARAKRNRPELAARLRSRRQLVGEIISSWNDTPGVTTRIDPLWAAALLAMEDGFRLHRLIDPETTPEDSFLQSASELLVAIGVGHS